MSVRLIYGAGKLGQQIATLYINAHGEGSIIGYIDDTQPTGKPIGTHMVLGSLDHVAKHPHMQQVPVLFAIGYSNMPARMQALTRLEESGLALASFIHPSAHVAQDATIADGVIIQAGAVVDIGCTIGAGSYLDIGALVGERVTLGKANYLSAGCVIGGSCTVGNGNFFGMQSALVEDIACGDYNRLHMQTALTRSIAHHAQVMEARTLRIL